VLIYLLQLLYSDVFELPETPVIALTTCQMSAVIDSPHLAGQVNLNVVAQRTTENELLGFRRTAETQYAHETVPSLETNPEKQFTIPMDIEINSPAYDNNQNEEKDITSLEKSCTTTSTLDEPDIDHQEATHLFSIPREECEIKSQIEQPMVIGNEVRQYQILDTFNGLAI
jgi:hypothetical protein